MKKITILLSASLISITARAFATEIIPPVILPVIQFMAPLTKSAEAVAISHQEKKIECDTTMPEIKTLKPVFKIPLKKGDQWSFSVASSMTAPPNTIKKEYVDATTPALKSELNSVIKAKYSSHQERLNSISKMCQGKSELDKIQMAAHLGGQLSNIYDYDRTDPGKPISSAVVTPEDQWNAMSDRANGKPSVSGVCRDATLTLTQFMVACGFSKKQLGIQSFRTDDGGHQIVTIRDSNGKLYTVNWSEAYATPEKGNIASQPHSSNLNSGIHFTTYDADGKLVSQQKTELGEIIKSVSGGTIDNPHYQPHLLKLEANFRGFTANLFEANTNYGEDAQGAAFSYKDQSKDETFFYSFGAAYVKNKNELEVSRSGKTATMEQTILYFQAEVGAQEKFKIYQNDNSLVTLKPFGLFSSEIYRTTNTTSFNPNKSFDNSGSTFTGHVGADLTLEKDQYAAWIKAKTKLAIENSGNTELTNNNIKLGVTTNGNVAAVGASHEGKKYVSSLEMQTEVSHYENRYSVSTSLFDKTTNSNGSIMYSVYDRGFGQRDDYVLIQGEKYFSFKKVASVSIGVGAQIPISGEDGPSVMATLKMKNK